MDIGVLNRMKERYSGFNSAQGAVESTETEFTLEFVRRRLLHEKPQMKQRERQSPSDDSVLFSRSASSGRGTSGSVATQ